MVVNSKAINDITNLEATWIPTLDTVFQYLDRLLPGTLPNRKPGISSNFSLHRENTFPLLSLLGKLNIIFYP